MTGNAVQILETDLSIRANPEPQMWRQVDNCRELHQEHRLGATLLRRYAVVRIQANFPAQFRTLTAMFLASLKLQRVGGVPQ